MVILCFTFSGLMEERDQLRNQVKRLKKSEKKIKNKMTELNGMVIQHLFAYL